MKQISIFFLCISSLIGASDNAIYVAEHAGSCGKWQVEFYKSGYAHESDEDICSDEKTISHYRLHRISTKNLEAIKQALIEVDFSNLPESIDPKTIVTDEDYYIITVLTEGKKSTFAQGLERAKDPEHAKRFQKVWQEINKIVKEPD